jgi:uncharacterized protein YigA (DUF484 family)
MRQSAQYLPSWKYPGKVGWDTASRRNVYDGALSLAERHLAKARRIVNQQKARIARLRAIGADSKDAKQTLRTFEANLHLRNSGMSSTARNEKGRFF